MKKITSLKLAGAVLASALAALAAHAGITINENVSLTGYAAGSIGYEKIHGAKTEIPVDIDAAKLQLDLTFEPLTAAVSIYTTKDPITDKNALYLLDANVSYDLGKGVSVTGGRFLTWIGYEEFDIPETNFVTWGNGSVFGSIIPDYHEGVKLEYTYGKNEFGFAVLDSIYSVEGEAYRGDGGLRDGLGFEAHYGYNETNWSMGANLGYQYGKRGYKTDIHGFDPYAESPKTYIADIWGEWNTGDITLAAELFYKYTRDEIHTGDSHTWYGLLMAKQQLDDKLSLAARLSYGSEKDFGNFWKLSVVPVSYEFTNMFSIRGEVSYTRYSSGIRDAGFQKYEFTGAVQAVFKF